MVKSGLGRIVSLSLLLPLAVACGDGATSGSGTSSGENPFGALIAEAPEGAAFYIPPAPVPGELGDVIWAREAGSVPGGKLYVVLYRSETLRGEPIGVSGWIGVPDGDAPEGGRPIMTWGHGTRGVADQCSPTIQDDPVSLDMPLLEALLARGIVVSASDYEGLGTPGLHPYVIGESEARSMLDAARAAQRFKPAAGNSTLIIAGHSQGGHAMAFANERAADYAPEFNVVGAVGSGAGVVEGEPFIPILLNGNLRGIMVLAMASQQAAYGADIAPPTRLLTELGVREMPNVEDGCWNHILSYFQQFTTEELFRPDWDLTFTNGENPNFINSAGNRPGAAPIFLVHGTEDTTIPAGFIPPYIEKTCSQGDTVDVRWYEGYGHRALYDPSSGAADAVLTWIDARLAGEAASSVCGNIPPIPGTE